MDFEIDYFDVRSIRFSVQEDAEEIARAYLYVLHNDLHKQPFGLMEDVFVEDSQRGRGIGSNLVEQVIRKAKEERCYKLICTSRHSRDKVHELYRSLGFNEHGFEFRIDFD